MIIITTIYSYRLEQAMKADMLRNVNLQNEIYKKIIYAVDIHRKAVELVFISLYIVYFMLAIFIRKMANIFFSFSIEFCNSAEITLRERV